VIVVEIKILELHKYYGNVHAVRGIDLEIPPGSFTVLVGPSGCGKSTLLRMIAGLEDVDAGIIQIGGQVVNHVRPRDRNIAMVFQNYALYPYLNVFENIAFGLRARKIPPQEINTRVHQAAEMLAITPLLDRFPRQLSGGQRQRVAIGRAIVRDAGLFLFDEPLSNLDAQLREEMRGEIKRLHQEIGKTMIYVTHDQIEAMTLADRIVLLKDGSIEQSGSPQDLYEKPQTKFVAGFLGSPQMNFLEGRLQFGDQSAYFDLGENLHLQIPETVNCSELQQGKMLLGVRPEHIIHTQGKSQPDPGQVRIPANVELVQPTGSRTYITFQIAGKTLIAEFDAHDVHQPGETVEIDIDMKMAHLIDPTSGLVVSNFS
jgi:multiple sugar transport system ATP-binding protein